MPKRPMNKMQTGANAIGFVALALLGLVAVNLVSSRLYGRVDLTQDRLFTLSKASKDLVKNLPDRMTIKAFISKGLEPPYSQTATYVRDLLEEYAQAAKGKLKWEAIDPGDDKALAEEAQKLGVRKEPRGTAGSGRIALTESYLGLGIQYQGAVKSIPSINGPEGLEFELTSLIKEMTVKKRKIAFASSEGELSMSGGDPTGGRGGGGLAWLQPVLRDVETQPVQLTQGAKPIADDVDALVIAGPKQPMSERAKFVVDQFLMRGKSVAFFVDGMVIEAANQMQMQIPGMDQPRIGRKNEGVPEDLLEHYGFKVRDDLIMEPQQNVPGPVPVGGRVLLANYPAFAVATNLAKDEPMLLGLRGAIFPFASSVETVKDKQPGMTVVTLAKSTAEAWRESGFFLFDPRAQLKPKDDHGPFTFAAYGQGKVKSFFAGKPYPNEKGEKVNPPDPNTSPAPGAEAPILESQGVARILVVGDSEFMSDDYAHHMARYVAPYQANRVLAVNMLSWLIQDDALAEVRAKTLVTRPLVVKPGTASMVKWGNVVGVPLLFILYGVLRWRIRTARRRGAKL